MKPLTLAAVLILLANVCTTQISLRTFSATVAAAAGDVDKDGHGDVVIASGSLVTVMSGRDGSRLRWFRPTTGTTFIRSVAGGADVNKDGYPDVVVGRPSATPNISTRNQDGVVRVWSGKDGKLLYERWGLWPLDRLGWTVAMVGDVNKDGYADFAGGGKDGPNGRGFGLLHVWSGKDGKLLHFFTGPGRNSWFAYSAAPAGDFNSDGHADILVGYGQRGSANVLSGKDGKTLLSFRDTRSVDIGVSELGDVDGDGRADVLLGSVGSKKASIYSGKTQRELRSVSSSGLNDFFAASVAGISDINGDKVPDFLVGAPGHPNVRNLVGFVTAYSGKEGKLLFTIKSKNADDGFGSLVRRAGDVNGDGAEDFLVVADRAKSITLYSGDVRPFTVDNVELSVSKGGTQKLFLNAGKQHALKTYWIAGTENGTVPGFRLRSLAVPLNPGAYFNLTITSPNTIIKNSLRGLDANGKGQASVTLPKTVPPVLVGRTFHHAYIVASLFPPTFDFVSNPVSVKLVK